MGGINARGKNESGSRSVAWVADSEKRECLGDFDCPAREMLADMLLLEMNRPGDAPLPITRLNSRSIQIASISLYGAGRSWPKWQSTDKANAVLPADS